MQQRTLITALMTLILLGIGMNRSSAQTSFINVSVFDDVDCDGERSANDNPLEGWTIWLDDDNDGMIDKGEDTAVTDAGGGMDILVDPGTYTVRIQANDGWFQTVPADGGALSVTIPPTNQPQFVSFGFNAAGIIVGRKYLDVNENGLRDGSEPGLAGWRIVLRGESCGGKLIAREATTEADGSYRFDGLLPGEYELTERMQDGWVQMQPGGAGFYDIELTPFDSLSFEFGNIAEFDFGDLDNSYGTLKANDGPRHVIADGVRLGALIDAESDGRPHVEALGDDLDADGDDDDGVSFLTSMIPGEPAVMEVNPSVAGLVYCWIDFNGNGRFDEPNERVIPGRRVAAGRQELEISIPASATSMSYVRVRFTTVEKSVRELEPIDRPGDILVDGEVEDYLLLDFGDIPEDGLNINTSRKRDGARHALSRLFLQTPGIPGASAPDSEEDARMAIGAVGDDMDNEMDEGDGIEFRTMLSPALLPQLQWGVPMEIRVDPTGPSYLTVFGDWNGDGDFDDKGERWVSEKLDAGAQTLFVPVPRPTPTWQSSPKSIFVRFRLGSARVLSPDGMHDDGEVEDYMVDIGDIDFGDAQEVPDGPGGTVNPGAAAHLIDPALYLGSSIDPERDGQPSHDAQGDDADILSPPVLNSDDEDGLHVATDLVSGRSAVVRITASKAGIVSLWIEDQGGVWVKLIDRKAVVGGINEFDVTIPKNNMPAPGEASHEAFLRLRLASAAGDVNAPVGLAADGEVEDYQKFVVAPGLPEIVGQKFNDLDANAQRNVNEPGIDGWVIHLLNLNGDTVATDTTRSFDIDRDEEIDPVRESGWYRFVLRPGEDEQLLYRVVEDQQSGWRQTVPGANREYRVYVAIDSGVQRRDFGNTQRGIIRGVKFADENGNGRRDGASRKGFHPQAGGLERGLPGWTIYLDLNGNGILDETEPNTMSLDDDPTTIDVDESGSYEFTGLEPGTYTVAEVAKAGWTQTRPMSGRYEVTIDSNEIVEGIEFGSMSTTSGVEPDASSLSAMSGSLQISPVAPNPVSTTATLTVMSGREGWIRIDILDVQGRLVSSLHGERNRGGSVRLQFDATKLVSGIYFVRASTSGSSVLRRFTVVR